MGCVAAFGRSALVAGLACAVLAGSIAGCAAIVGVDFGDAHPRLQSADVDAAVDSASPPAVPSLCGAREKTCSGACVSNDDPAFGCASTACDRCSVPFSSASECRGGACAAKACVADRGDCDGNPSNGCETDLTTTADCRACGTKCAPGDVCAPTGCAATCPNGLSNCGGSCVDLTRSPTHCGSCTTVCAVPLNSDATCVSGACGIACRAGFADCDGNSLNGCEPLTVFFRDDDGDGYGTSASTKEACSLPAGYRAVGGDCDDTNASVHPGQTAYFPVGYPKAAGVSFDYDCNGAEQRNPATTLYPGCGAGCSGSGYTPAQPARSGAGVDPYCGSTFVSYCYMTTSCNQGGTASASPFACR